MPIEFRLKLDIDHIVKLYRSGQSVKQIAEAVGCSRSCIITRLEARGICARNRSEAELLKWRRIKEDPALVRRQCGAAWRAVTGTKRSHEILCRSAQARIRRQSPDEVKMLALLHGHGINAEHQLPIGPYNVDFAIHEGRIAVEHQIGPLRSKPRVGDSLGRKRIEYLNGQGWAVICLNISKSWQRRHPLAKAVQALVANMDMLRADPPSAGEYWVVRCECDSAARPQVKVYKRAAI